MTSLPPHTRYIPLVRTGSRYAAAAESDFLEDVGLGQVQLHEYLAKNHVAIEAQVELEGRLYSTSILAPRSGNDYAYVLVNEDGTPLTSTHAECESTEDLDSYLSTIRSQLSFSEAALHDAVSNLDSEFIRPHLRILSPTSSAEMPGTAGWDSIFRFARFVLLGAPGAGKTSCLRRFALEMSEAPSPRLRQLPVYVQLRDVDDSFDLSSVQRILENNAAPAVAERLPKLSRDGLVFLLFDGLDEVPDARRSAVTDSINRLAHMHPHLSMGISVRSNCYNWAFPDFVHLEIQPFGQAQIAEWTCKKIFPRKSWKDFLAQLKESPRLYELAGNPLLLALITVLYIRHSTTPHSEAQIIARFIHTLVDEWDTIRGITRSESQWAAPHRQLTRLYRLSFNAACHNVKDLQAKDYDAWCNIWAEDEPGSAEVLQTLAEHTGLLRRQVNDSWRFASDTIARHLAAQYLVDSTGDATEFLQARLGQREWQLVWLSSCGTTVDASDLIRRCIESSALSEDAKAGLVLEAFAQGANIEKALITQASRLAVIYIESQLQAFDVARVTSVAGLWAISFVRNTSAAVKKEVAYLRPVLRSLYKARSSSASKILMTLLRESVISAVRNFSESLSINGSFVDAHREQDGQDILNIEILPEYPEVNIP